MNLKKSLIRLFDSISRHEVFLLSGSIAYTTALALAPFLLILLFIASFLSPEMQSRIFSEISMALGSKAGKTVLDIIQQARENPKISGASGLGGVLILVVSASAIFSQLRIALDKINEIIIPENYLGFWGFVRNKVFTFGLVLGFIFLSIVSLMVSTMISVLVDGGEGWYWQIMFLLINFALFTVLFASIYRFVPSRSFEWRRAWISGIVGSAFYLVGRSLITVYLGHAGFDSSYGAAGSFVVFLVWVYYTSLMLLISCEFTNVLYKPTRRSRLLHLLPF